MERLFSSNRLAGSVAVVEINLWVVDTLHSRSVSFESYYRLILAMYLDTV